MKMSRRVTNAVRASIVLLLIVHGVIAQDSCEKSPWNNHLLLVKEGSIIKANLDGENQGLALESPSISGLFNSYEYSHAQKSLYWGDFGDFDAAKIWKLRDGESEPELAVPNQGRWLPCKIKVDDLTNKMYVLDCWSSSINIFDLDTGDQAVVLAKNFTEIRTFEMDSTAGYLFIVDKYKILRTDLDGKNTLILREEFTNLDQEYTDIWNDLPEDVKQYLNNPDQIRSDESSKEMIRKVQFISDVVLDAESKRVYFVDTVKRCVQSFDYNGKNHRVHFQDVQKGNPSESESSLSFSNGWLYWLDKINQKLYKINAENENQTQIILKNEDTQVVFTVECLKNRQISKNPCAKNNGQCQQLCITSKISKENYTCACKIGYELSSDGKSCFPVQEFILYTLSGSLRGHISNVSSQTFTDAINPSAFSVGKGAELQFNAADNIIYYSSLYPDNQIHQLNLRTSEVKILQPDLLSSKVGQHMAFDWESRNLYYFTYYYGDTTTLSVINVDNPTYGKILIPNVQRLIRSIEVHPYRGYVYFAQMSDDDWTTISRVCSDGSGLKVLVHQKGAINDLAIDYQENRLYWSEPRKLWYSNLDGQNIKELKIANTLVGDIGSLTIHKNYIYTISKQDQLLVRLDKNNLSLATIVIRSEESGSLSGIEIISQSSQKKKPGHPCSQLSQHKCPKFCFAVPDLLGGIKATCGCPYGEKLARDGRSCEDNRVKEPNFAPCESSSYRCNMKTES